MSFRAGCELYHQWLSQAAVVHRSPSNSLLSGLEHGEQLIGLMGELFQRYFPFCHSHQGFR